MNKPSFIHLKLVKSLICICLRCHLQTLQVTDIHLQAPLTTLKDEIRLKVFSCFSCGRKENKLSAKGWGETPRRRTGSTIFPQSPNNDYFHDQNFHFNTYTVCPRSLDPFYCMSLVNHFLL